MPFAVAILIGLLSAPHVSWIPTAGRTIGAGGREFTTTLLITNESDREAQLTLAFFPSAKPGLEPRSLQLTVAPRRMLLHDFGPGLAREGENAGAIRLTSTQLVSVETRISSHDPSTPESAVGATYGAIDAASAIGTAETTRIIGPSPGARYTLHAVETAGYSLTLIATMFDSNGRALGSKRLYLAANEQRSWNFQESFAQLQLGGMSGSGRVAAVGTEILPGTQDLVVHEMTRRRVPRHRMPAGEMAAYAVVALAVAAAAIYSRKKQTSS